MLRVVYAGTPDFAVPALEALLRGPHTVVAVYTQPDRPAGRGRRLRPSPIKQRALEADIPVAQPVDFKDPDSVATLAALAPDVLVVAAYGLILPQAVLDVPRLGALNIHASLLPRWRGAAPIQRAIQAGDRNTGVCLMEMAAGLDTGPVVACRATPIGPEDTGGRLHDRLATLGAQLLTDALDDWAAGALPATPQPADGVTYAARITTAEAHVDWTMPAADLARRVRAFNPWPVVRCEHRGEPLRIWAAEALDSASAASAPPPGRSADPRPGTVLATGAAGIDVSTGHGRLRLLQVQVPGGRAQAAADFLRGHAVDVGEVLG